MPVAAFPVPVARVAGGGIGSVELAARSGPYRVMVVEDEALIALDIEQRLRRLGYAVGGVADTFDDALELFRECTPDLVLLDISIRGPIDGIETARAIVAERDVPVIFLTAYADDNTLRRAAEVSPYGYLLKPFDERTLAVTLKVALERHAADTRVRLLSAALESATVGITLVDAREPARPVVFANRAYLAMSGADSAAVLGAPSTFLAADPAAAGVQRLRDAVEALGHAEGTVLGHRPDATPLWLSVSVSPAPDRSGRVTHLLVFHQDVTREHTAESNLAASQRLELAGRLGAGVAHDLNNVLGAVMTFAELVGHRLEDPMQRALIDEITSAATRGALVTRRFLDFSTHAEADTDAVSDLSRVIGDTRPMLVQLAGPRVTIALRVAPEPALVRAEVASIEQILLNLVALASDGMPDGGLVSIRAMRPEGATDRFEAGAYIRIEVTATPASPIDPVAIASDSPAHATCRMLVERVGGTLERSAADGGGTCVVIDVPLAEAAVPEVVRALDERVVGNAGGACCLLVEDEPASRRAYARALEAVGFDVVHAATAELAVRELDAHPERVRLLICDIVLPGIGGAAVITHAARVAPGAGVLVITGSRNPSGIPPETPVLWKPFGADTLARRALDALSAPAPVEALAPAHDPLEAVRPVEPDMAVALRPSVLVVDDDKMSMAVIGSVLESRGLQVLRAECGGDALELAAAHPLQLALVDVNLPDVDGVDLLASLRAGDPLLPTIVVTGDRSLATAQRSMRARASGYITKPFDRSQLIDEVERALAEGQLARLQHKFLISKAGLNAQFVDFATTAADFDAALAGLYMAYQPIVRPHDRSVFAYEALLRTNSQALRDPSQLLAAAEALGRIPELGHAVRAHIADTLLQHPDHTEPIFVNLHPSELRAELASPDEPLMPFASRVVLEVTERDQLGSGEALRETLRTLRTAGYQVALDDLGEGYAGLSWLVKLAPDIAKLDMSLVRDIDRSRLKRELVSSLVGVGRRARTVIVAEGVETEAEARVLADLGCDLLQGYHFARPGLPFPRVLPVEAAEPAAPPTA